MLDRPREEVEEELAGFGQELDAAGKPRDTRDQMGNPIPNKTQERPLVVLDMIEVSEKMATGELKPGDWIELPPRGMAETSGPKMQLKEEHRGPGAGAPRPPVPVNPAGFDPMIPDVNAGWQQNPAFIDPMRAPANPVQQILQQNR